MFSSLPALAERVNAVVLPLPEKVFTIVSPLPTAALNARTVRVSPVFAPVERETLFPVFAITSVPFNSKTPFKNISTFEVLYVRVLPLLSAPEKVVCELLAVKTKVSRIAVDPAPISTILGLPASFFFV